MYSVITFDTMGDHKGSLIAIEGNKNIPFHIQRMFYIFGTLGDAVRGCHANRRSRFILIAVKGSCNVLVRSKTRATSIQLDHPTKGLFLDRMVWKEMTQFSEDSVLLVVSDAPYDPDEYVTNYKQYLIETPHD